MDFQKLLLRVGKALAVDEVKAMAFLCWEALGAGAAAVGSSSDLFSRLMDRDLLSVERPHLLIELLHVIQRAPLARSIEVELGGHRGTSADAEVITPGRSVISPYR